jgi:hypothetical protein
VTLGDSDEPRVLGPAGTLSQRAVNDEPSFGPDPVGITHRDLEDTTLMIEHSGSVE